jgi:hypothetical protein
MCNLLSNYLSSENVIASKGLSVSHFSFKLWSHVITQKKTFQLISAERNNCTILYFLFTFESVSTTNNVNGSNSGLLHNTRKK